MKGVVLSPERATGIPSREPPTPMKCALIPALWRLSMARRGLGPENRSLLCAQGPAGGDTVAVGVGVDARHDVEQPPPLILADGLEVRRGGMEALGFHTVGADDLMTRQQDVHVGDLRQRTIDQDAPVVHQV